MEKFKMVVTKIQHETKLPKEKFEQMLDYLDSDDYRVTHVHLEEYTIIVLIDNETYFKKPENPEQNIIFFVQFIFENPDLFAYGNSFTYDGIRFTALM